jgi:hypothetical protein
MNIQTAFTFSGILFVVFFLSLRLHGAFSQLVLVVKPWHPSVLSPRSNLAFKADARKAARRLTSALALRENPCHSNPGIIKRHSASQAFCSVCFAVSLGFRLQTGLLFCNLFPTS